MFLRGTYDYMVLDIFKMKVQNWSATPICAINMLMYLEV